MTKCWMKSFGTNAFMACLAALLAVFFVIATGAGTAEAQNVRPPANAVNSGGGPQTTADRGGNYDIEIWGELRKGAKGTVSIPDKKAGILVDASGETFRAWRNGPLATYGIYAILGIIGALAIFYLIRGKVRIEHGMSGVTIERFTDFERIGHWLLATSFIILALTGLNTLYGQYALLPVMGKEAFAAMTQLAKWLHNYVAFAFMVGLAMTFATWVWYNFPHPRDLAWFLKGGGILGGAHPEAKKFNGGQKILFWLVMLGGLSLSLSGLQLLLPYELSFFGKTFAIINVFGFDLPTTLTANQEQQYALLWHGMMSIFLTCVIIAHIYIGSVGMEGAFDAMGSGEVDVNWAKEHHSLWAEEEPGHKAAAGSGSARPTPAE